MQGYAKINRAALGKILFFTVVLFVTFLPVSSFIFFIKNDAFNGYFPPKFFMSESLHAGYIPLWNPYINFGFPQYGDMSGGFWSPVTWLIALTVGYTPYTFTIEALSYILIGGIGMHQLCGYFKLSQVARIMAGLAFMCSGFNVGHLQHFNWLSGAAFLPWCFYSYLLLFKSASAKNILLNIFLFYMLVASAHPGISIGAAYFFLAVFMFMFVKKRAACLPQKIRQSLFPQFILLTGFVLLSAGMIMGYMDILPHFVRGEKLTADDISGNGTGLRSWMSVLLPFATVKNDGFFLTDLSLRNSYFGLTGILFFLLALTRRSTGWQQYLRVCGAIFFLLSLGGMFTSFAHRFLPMIGFVRLTGEFRIFALICFIPVAAMELDKFLREAMVWSGRIKYIYWILEAALAAAITYGLICSIDKHDSFLYRLETISAAGGLSSKLKALVDGISFYDTLWIQGFIQLFLIWSLKYSLREKRMGLLKKIIVADLVIACLLNIPFTGAGKASVSDLQQVLGKSPHGIPIPSLEAISAHDSLPPAEKFLLGNWSMYNKQIGVKNWVPYPILLNNMHAYFMAAEKDSATTYLHRGFIFLENEQRGDTVSISHFSPNEIQLDVVASAPGKMILQQNYYPHWFYNNGSGKRSVDPAGMNFMSVPINKGRQHIVISFEPTNIKTAMIFSAVLFLLLIAALLYVYFKSPSLSSRQPPPGPSPAPHKAG
ncbi:MAG: putative rane protein [Ferruginibacter sp.]|nr:putative rane protein [Ferruginibacter sp.]